MTTQKARGKLGGIMEKMATYQFSEKYKMIQSQILPQSIPDTLSAYSDAADAYIVLASKHAREPVMLDFLSLCANPLVVFVVYARYHRLTQMFMSSDQKKEWDFSTKTADFLTDVLIDEWRSLNGR